MQTLTWFRDGKEKVLITTNVLKTKMKQGMIFNCGKLYVKIVDRFRLH